MAETKERERNSLFLPLPLYASDSHTGWGWVSLKLGARSLIWRFSIWVARALALGPFFATFPRPLARCWIRWDSNQYPYGMTVL